MKKSVFVGCLIFVCVKAYSQPSFSKGYIIRQSGDTLRGYIKDESYDNLYNRVVFKKAKSGSETQEFQPRDIRGFYIFEGKQWMESKRIAIPDKADPLQSKRIYRENFLKHLISGNVDLFVMRHKGLYCMFISGAEDVAPDPLWAVVKYDQELTDTLTQFKVSPSQQVQKLYIATLNDHMRDCPERLGVDPLTPLMPTEIGRQIYRYNKCADPATARKYFDQKISLQLYAGMGYPIPYLQAERQRYILGNYPGDPLEQTKIGYATQLGLQLRFPGSFKNAGIELNWQSYNTEVQYKHETSGIQSDYQQQFISVRFYYLSMPKSLISPMAYVGGGWFHDSRDLTFDSPINDRVLTRTRFNFAWGIGAECNFTARYRLRLCASYPAFPTLTASLGVRI